jgi:hypothetical protein
MMLKLEKNKKIRITPEFILGGLSYYIIHNIDIPYLVDMEYLLGLELLYNS